MKTQHEPPRRVTKKEIRANIYISIAALEAMTGISQNKLFNIRSTLQSNGELNKLNFAREVILHLQRMEEEDKITQRFLLE